jgi:hypothetical protein
MSRQLHPGRGAHPGFCLRSNSLIRMSDRVEGLSWLAAVVVGLLAIPIALTVATVVHTDLAARADAQATSRHQETAVLLEDAGSGGGTYARNLSVRTPAVWSGPGGTSVRGLVPALRGTQAGEAVDIWADEEGLVVAPPLDRSVVMGNTVMAGTMVFVLTGTVAIVGHLVICAFLGRYRARQWERGWAAVEPRWAGRAGC